MTFSFILRKAELESVFLTLTLKEKRSRGEHVRTSYLPNVAVLKKKKKISPQIDQSNYQSKFWQARQIPLFRRANGPSPPFAEPHTLSC